MDVIDEWAPGLRQLPETLGFARSAIDSGNYGALADPGRIDSYASLLLVGSVIYLLCAFGIRVLRGDRRRERRAARADDRPLRRRRMPLWRRLKLWWIHKFDQPWPWRLGTLTVYLNQTHGLIVGGSGSGKSTAVVALILQQVEAYVHHLVIPRPSAMFMSLMRRLGIWRRRAVLIISFDRSDPIEEATNEVEDLGIPVTRWRVRDDCGWDLLQGDIEMLAEAIPDAWAKTSDDTGFFRQLASDGLSAAMRDADADGVPREWHDIVARADRIMAADPECPELARQTWVRRFKSLGRIMGPSFGNDFDLVSALREPGAVVHISSNSYTSQVVTPLVGVMGLVQAKLAAEQVGDVILVLEEAAFLKRRASVLEDIARSMRARGWRVVYVSQDPNDVGSVLQVNFGVAIFMGLGPLASKARQWCADVVKGFPGAFREQELVLGAMLDELEGYVLWKGRCRDVSLAPYITGAARRRAAGTPKRPAPARRSGTSAPGRMTMITVIDPDRSAGSRAGGPVLEAPGAPRALPAGVKVMPTFILGMDSQRSYDFAARRRLWDTLDGTWNPTADHLWTKGRNRAYGKASYLSRAGWPAHFLFWAWRVLEDRELGREGDLERFYRRFPDVPRFEPPASDGELVILDAMRRWQRAHDLDVDHACPGFPNALCCNYLHLRLTMGVTNGQLRASRRNGAGRLAAEVEAEV